MGTTKSKTSSETTGTTPRIKPGGEGHVTGRTDRPIDPQERRNMSPVEKSGAKAKPPIKKESTSSSGTASVSSVQSGVTTRSVNGPPDAVVLANTPKTPPRLPISGGESRKEHTKASEAIRKSETICKLEEVHSIPKAVSVTPPTHRKEPEIQARPLTITAQKGTDLSKPSTPTASPLAFESSTKQTPATQQKSSEPLSKPVEPIQKSETVVSSRITEASVKEVLVSTQRPSESLQKSVSSIPIEAFSKIEGGLKNVETRLGEGLNKIQELVASVQLAASVQKATQAAVEGRIGEGLARIHESLTTGQKSAQAAVESRMGERLGKIQESFSTAQRTTQTAVEGRISEGLEKIQESLETLQKMAQTILAPKPVSKEEPRPSTTLDDEMDQISRSLKRSLIEVFERSEERLATPLTRIQRGLEEIGQKCGVEAASVKAHIVGYAMILFDVLQDLGVERYVADEGEYYDPMIHQCVGEDLLEGRDSGVVIRSVSPGYRSANGHVLLPALVIVNRK